MKTDIVGLLAVAVAGFLGYSYLKQKESVTTTQQKLAMTGLTPEQAAAISTAQGNAVGAQAGLAQNSAAVAVSTATPGSNATAVYTPATSSAITNPSYIPGSTAYPAAPDLAGVPDLQNVYDLLGMPYSVGIPSMVQSHPGSNLAPDYSKGWM